MKSNRRDVLRGSVAVAVQSVLYPGVVVSIASCGGGGGGNSGSSEPAPSGLSYSTPVQLTQGVPTTPLMPTVTGAVSSYSVSPTLPAGLSLDSTSGVVSGTPSATAAQATYTITAANSAGRATFAVVLTVNPALIIAGLSSSSPMALTPLTISTKGLNVGQPFTVNFAITAGMSSTLSPFRTDNDGTLHVALPLNLDPTGTTGGYSAMLSLTQGSQTTTASTIAVQDIPTLASYGTTLGAISHAFYNYLAISHARVVNELQAIGTNYTSVDTSANQSTLTSFALDALHARNDIDRVTNENTLQIAAGVDPTGAQIYFTQSSVEIQDRMFGFYLTQLQGSVSATPASLKALARHTHKANKAGNRLVYSTASDLNLLTTVLGATITGTLGVSAGIANAVSPASNTNNLTAALDSASAVLFGATKFLAVAGVGTAGATDFAAAVTGILGAGCALTSDLIKYSNSQDQIIALQSSGSSQAALTAAIDQRNAAGVSAFTDILGGVLSALPASSAVKDVLDSSLATNVIYQGSALVGSIAGLSVDAIGQQITSAQAAGNQLSTVAPNAGSGFADLTGSCSISNTNSGTDLQSLYEANLAIPGTSNSTQLNSISDTAGNYDVLVPLASTALDYANATLNIQDPSTGTVLGSEVVNLSTLTDAGASPPSLSGVCTDDDASTPDGDDPDCD